MKFNKKNNESNNGVLDSKKTSLRQKMLISISLPLIVVLLISAYFISSTVGGAVSELSWKAIHAESDTISKEVAGFLGKYSNAAILAGQNSQIKSIFEDTLPGQSMTSSKYYKEVMNTLYASDNFDSDSILATWISDFDSNTLIGSDDWIPDSDFEVTSRPWYEVASTKNPIITAPYLDATTNEQVITIGAPVFNDANQPIGIFAFDLLLNDLSVIMNAHNVGDNGFFILFDQDGIIVHHPNSNFIGSSVSDFQISDEGMSAINAGIDADLEYFVDGKPYLGTLHQVDNSPWTVLTALPKSEAFAPYYNTLFAIIITFIITIGVIIASIMYISRKITLSLKKVGASAKEIADGNLDTFIAVKTNDEIGNIALALLNTVDRLKKYIDYIDEITMTLDQISNGDLTFELKQDYEGEFGKLKNALLSFRETMTATLSEIKTSSEQVNAGSSQFYMGSQLLASGTTEQAATVEELSSSVADLNERVAQSAQLSSNANDGAVIAGKGITECNDQMKELLLAMDDISKKSNEISKIIKAIEEIAYQTNILALNAAIEAARSGAAGKGFAVVADEVRNLAAKSSQAAKTSSTLIEESLEAVSRGNKLTRETATRLNKVYGEASVVVSSMEMINLSNQEQAMAISQINEGLEQVAAVIHTNSATAEESAATSKELQAQADILSGLVNSFKTDTSDSFYRESHISKGEDTTLETDYNTSKY